MLELEAQLVLEIVSVRLGASSWRAVCGLGESRVINSDRPWCHIKELDVMCDHMRAFPAL